MRITLEIAVTTADEAVAAVRAGADRLELAAALELGGLTPSPGLFSRVRELVSVPVWVLLRPRPGGFLYSEHELETVRRDAEWFFRAGADGLVFGALDSANRIAEDPCRQLAILARGRMTFHRAIDFALDPAEALERLIELGYRRILTSGAAATALEGADSIRMLTSRAARRIEVMPGGGIRPDTIAELVRVTGCDQVHAAARSQVTDPSLSRHPALALAMGSNADCRWATTDATLVAALRCELDRLASLR